MKKYTHARRGIQKIIYFAIVLIFLSSIVGAPAPILPAAAEPQDWPDTEYLKDMAGGATRNGFSDRDDVQPFLIGNIAKSGWTSQDQNIVRQEFNFLTSENAMKMDTVQSSQNNFNWSEADAHVQFAQDNGLKYHGHTLVWHSQVPQWVKNLPRNQVLDTMKNHINTVMGRYKGKIYVWDVVNEAFNDDGSYRTSDSVWNTQIGQSYIEEAFTTARAADPDAKLIYNDYNTERIDAKFNAMLTMVTDLKSKGLIDGVGFQMHLTDTDFPDANARIKFSEKMQKLADLGLEIYITELDVRFSTSNNELSTDQKTKQADIYKWVMDACYSQPACKGLQIWGVSDKDSWVPNTFSGQGGALIYDKNYNPKPAYNAIKDSLSCDVGLYFKSEGGNFGGPLAIVSYRKFPTDPNDVWEVSLTYHSGMQVQSVTSSEDATYTLSGQTITLKSGVNSNKSIWGLILPQPRVFGTYSGTYKRPFVSCKLKWLESARMQAQPADGAIYLKWGIDATKLPDGAKTQYFTRVEYFTAASAEPTTATYDYNVSSVVLDDVQNYQVYTINLSTMLGDTVWVSDTVRVMPTDNLLYLPILVGK